MNTIMTKCASNLTPKQRRQCHEAYICSPRAICMVHRNASGEWKMRIAKVLIPTTLKNYLRMEQYDYYWKFIVSATFAREFLEKSYPEDMIIPSPTTEPQENVTAPYWDDHGDLYDVETLFEIWKAFYMIPDPPAGYANGRHRLTKSEVVDMMLQVKGFEVQVVWMASEKLCKGTYQDGKPVMTICPMLIRGDTARDILTQGRYLNTEEGAIYFLAQYYTNYMKKPNPSLPIPLGIMTDRTPVNEVNSSAAEILTLYNPHTVIPPMHPAYRSQTGIGPKWSEDGDDTRTEAMQSGGRELDEKVDKGCVRLMQEIFKYNGDEKRVPDTFLAPKAIDPMPSEGTPQLPDEDGDDDVDTKVLDETVSELVQRLDHEIDVIVKEKLGMSFDELKLITQKLAKKRGLSAEAGSEVPTVDGKEVQIIPNVSGVVRRLYSDDASRITDLNDPLVVSSDAIDPDLVGAKVVGKYGGTPKNPESEEDEA